MPRVRQRPSLPTRDELIALAHERGGRLSTNDLARELGLKGGARAALRRQIEDLRHEGLVQGRGGRRAVERQAKTGMTVVEIAAVGDDGELIGESRSLPGAGIVVVEENGRASAAKVGDKALVRLEQDADGVFTGTIFKLLPGTPEEVIGIVEPVADGYILRPTRRDAKRDYPLEPMQDKQLEPGTLVRAKLRPGRPLAPPRAQVIEVLGRADDPAAVSLSVAGDLGLEMTFSPAALRQAEAARPVELGHRTDLRDVDLVTIDGADARDFDDAVWAAPDDSSDNKDGFQAIVAIADVAHYVRPLDALDKDALKRGNSVYFPDRVIPMLPEALSNDLCSLRPDEDRACLAVRLRFDKEGELKDWRFMRALMRSRARLTYEQVQAARDGEPDPALEPLMQPVIEPLFALFERLLEARHRRGTIELDLPERRVVFGEDGMIAAIEPRARLASHQLIEELMIAANVAAARALGDAKLPCLYRVHDKPDAERLGTLADYLEPLGIGWSRTARKPADFTRLLRRIEDDDLREQVSSFVLRAQAQAVYTPSNIGHFGLNLRAYAHFTSPIRRYADLVVHRLLIHHLGLDGRQDGRDYDEEQLAGIGAEVSALERKAVDAERRAMARYLALFMRDKVGATFRGRITGVQRFGLFVTLKDSGAEGLVPVSTLGEDFFHHDEQHHVLIGERYGEAFGMGDSVEVELAESDIARGMLIFRVKAHERGHIANEVRRNWRPGGRRRQQTRPHGRKAHRRR